MPTAIMVHGKMDGVEVKIPPRTKIPGEMVLGSGTHFALAEDGECINIMSGPLSKRWHSYQGVLYKNAETKDPQGRHVFHFHSTHMVDRCHAATQKGDWCKNTAEQGGHLCKTHAAQEAPLLFLEE